MNPILGVVLVIVVLVLIISFLQFFMSIRPVRHYSKDNPTNYGMKYENVSFMTKDKITIKAWLIESKKANGTVIIGHGYPFDKGNILPVAKFLYPDYNLLFYDHRYFGESSGKITTVGVKEVEDVRAAVGFVKRKFGKEKPIALYGFSLSASTMLMSKAEVNAIISDSAYASLENMVKQTYRIFGPLKFPFVEATNIFSIIFFGVNPRKVSPVLAIKEIDAPILVIHGDKDSQIPVENAHLLKESKPDVEFWIVKGCDHIQAHNLYKKQYEKRIKDFLKKSMLK